MNKYRILVTAAGGASGLYTIKLLKEDKSNYLVGVDPDQNAVGLTLADKWYITPKANDSRFIYEIAKIVTLEKIDVVIPNISDELPQFAKNLRKIPCRVVISPSKTIDICNDKYKTYHYFQNFVPVPKYYEERNDLKYRFPVFIKPRIARGSKKGYKVINTRQLDQTLKFLKEFGTTRDNLVISEFLPGKEYTVDVLCDFSGKQIVSVSRQRVHTQSGISTVAQFIKNEKIDLVVGKITSALRFFGPINIQLKEDVKGEMVLQEINPRLSGGISLTAKAGVNIPMMLLRLLAGKQMSTVKKSYKLIKVGRYYSDIELISS